MAELTASALNQLLQRLDPDENQAVEKYGTLRFKLTEFFKWRGCPESQADDLADETLDRVALKIAGGEKVASLAAYVNTIARYVHLEHQRKHKEDAAGDDLPEVAVQPDFAADPDERLRCLRKCLPETVPQPQDQQLIIGYYETGEGAKLKEQRKNLAARLGLTMINLKVRASRLRDRLERCINECAGP